MRYALFVGGQVVKQQGQTCSSGFFMTAGVRMFCELEGTNADYRVGPAFSYPGRH